MKPEKKEIEDKKKELKKQFDELSAKIKQGREAMRNMEATLISLQGAIQQCNWTLELFKEENKK